MTNQILNIDNANSYATEENLNKALVRSNLNDVDHLTVCNRAGRFTAIFTLCRCDQAKVNPGYPAQMGFPIVS